MSSIRNKHPEIRSSRRDFLRVGAFGTTLTLGDYLRHAAAGQVAPKATAKAAIFIFLNGGPPHLDTFDLKPDATEDIRGEFKPIKTNVPGIEICEHLPRLAKVADKFALVRSVSHSIAAHELGIKYLLTGNRPTPSVEYPGYGSVAAKELAAPPDLPAYVAIPKTPVGGGFLGVETTPFNTVVTPAQPGAAFNVRGISLARSLTAGVVEAREKLLADLDGKFTGKMDDDLLAGLDKFSQRAYDIIRSEKSRNAFDVGQEPLAVAKGFGAHSFGQSCLLAARLVQAGVRFVTIDSTGWDTHANNFKLLKDEKLPKLDDGVSALLTTLQDRGLLQETLVVVTGEFGRTPKVNKDAGRDHWSRSMSVLIAGGGVKGAQVIGKTDATGSLPTTEQISPDSLAATMFHCLGINPQNVYPGAGRPITLVREGRVIRDLL